MDAWASRSRLWASFGLASQQTRPTSPHDLSTRALKLNFGLILRSTVFGLRTTGFLLPEIPRIPIRVLRKCSRPPGSRSDDCTGSQIRAAQLPPCGGRWRRHAILTPDGWHSGEIRGRGTPLPAVQAHKSTVRRVARRWPKTRSGGRLGGSRRLATLGRPPTSPSVDLVSVGGGRRGIWGKLADFWQCSGAGEREPEGEE